MSRICSPRREPAVPWLRQSVADLSLPRPGFQSRPVHVGYAVDSGAGTGFSPSTYIYACHCYSTNA
jgi:hypothetical protein